MADSLIDSGTGPADWRSAQPRPAYRAYQRVPLPAERGWYETYLVLPGVYAIYEPGHIEEVISYLIIGDERALLWDTGMGIVPIRPVAERLTDLPVIAANSHSHHDHVGGNWEFPYVYAMPAPGGEARAAVGYSSAFLAPMASPENLAKPLPAGFAPAAYTIRPWQAAVLPISNRGGSRGYGSSSSSSSGAAHGGLLTGVPPLLGIPAAPSTLFTGCSFDLGGRQLDILATPGHSPDSLMLLDRQSGFLFTGDTVYPAALYAHFDSAEYGKSSVVAYAQTMDALRKLAPYLTCLCCSHNVPLHSPDLLPDIADAFRQVLSGQSKGLPYKGGHTYHGFDGFSIVV